MEIIKKMKVILIVIVILINNNLKMNYKSIKIFKFNYLKKLL